jgi:hypothetical protein
MIRALLRVVGLLLALVGVYLAWRAFDANDNARKWENESMKRASERIRSKGRVDTGVGAADDKSEEMKKERNMWGAGAGGAFIVGLVLVLLPSSRKRKRRSTEGVSMTNPPTAEAEGIVAPLRDDPEIREGISADKKGPTV